AFADAAAADLERDAEPASHFGEQDHSRRKDLGPCPVDAEAARDLPGRAGLDEAQRLGQLLLSELRADEPACCAGAAPDDERRLDRRRLERAEHPPRLGL